MSGWLLLRTHLGTWRMYNIICVSTKYIHMSYFKKPSSNFSQDTISQGIFQFFMVENYWAYELSVKSLKREQNHGFDSSWRKNSIESSLACRTLTRTVESRVSLLGPPFFTSQFLREL